MNVIRSSSSGAAALGVALCLAASKGTIPAGVDVALIEDAAGRVGVRVRSDKGPVRVGADIGPARRGGVQAALLVWRVGATGPSYVKRFEAPDVYADALLATVALAVPQLGPDGFLGAAAEGLVAFGWDARNGGLGQPDELLAEHRGVTSTLLHRPPGAAGLLLRYEGDSTEVLCRSIESVADAAATARAIPPVLLPAGVAVPARGWALATLAPAA